MDIGRLDTRLILLVPQSDGTYKEDSTIWCLLEHANNRRASNFDIANPSTKGSFMKLTTRFSKKLYSKLHTNCRFKRKPVYKGDTGDLFSIENITHDLDSIQVSLRLVGANILLGDFCDIFSITEVNVPAQYGFKARREYRYPSDPTHTDVKCRFANEFKLLSESKPADFENNIAQMLFAEGTPVKQEDILLYNERYYKIETVTDNRDGYIECQLIVMNKTGANWGL